MLGLVFVLFVIGVGCWWLLGAAPCPVAAGERGSGRRGACRVSKTLWCCLPRSCTGMGWIEPKENFGSGLAYCLFGLTLFSVLSPELVVAGPVQPAVTWVTQTLLFGRTGGSQANLL